MARPNGILAGGNWIVDHLKLIDSWPAQDTLVNILEQKSGNGGSPYNLLKNLSRLGATFPLEAVGLVGDDANGQAILADCRRHGISTTQLQQTAHAPTSYTDVMTVRGSGRRTFFHQRGANAHLDVGHFDFSRSRAKIFHLGYLLLLDRLDEMEDGRPRVREVLQRARAAGMITSVDCVSEASDRFTQVILPALPSADVLLANDYEAERLSGVRLREGDRILSQGVEEAARILLDHGVEQWVIIHFPEAVYACGRDSVGVWQPSLKFPSEKIVGSAGAGDALAAGVLFGLHEGWPISRCLQLGVSAAALSLTDASCSDGVRPVGECFEAAARWGYRTSPESSPTGDLTRMRG